MILKYLDIQLPLSPYQISGRVFKFEWSQTRYEHDFGVIKFNDWAVDPVAVVAGTPIKVTATMEDRQNTFYGYIHHVKHVRSSHNNYTEVYVIGESYVMKQADQKIYHNVTATDVVRKIAIKHKFAYDITPHGRVYPQIAQSGRTDWQLLTDLAIQCGYTLRSEKATIHFKPVSEDFIKMKPTSQVFFSVGPDSVVKPTLYRMEPVIGETLEYATGYKASAAISGVDPKSGKPFAVINASQPSGLRGTQNPDFFDRYDTSTTAINRDAAKYEAAAVDELNKFPYRASALLLGTPDLRPDMPIFVTNVDSELDGYWMVLETRHIIDGDNYVTEVVLGTDSLGGYAPAPTSNGIAQVTRVSEPNLMQTAASIKPTSLIKMSKVANRLSQSPATAVNAVWINASGSVKSKANASAKVAASLAN